MFSGCSNLRGKKQKTVNEQPFGLSIHRFRPDIKSILNPLAVCQGRARPWQGQTHHITLYRINLYTNLSFFPVPRDTATAVPIRKDGFVGNEWTSWPGNFDTGHLMQTGKGLCIQPLTRTLAHYQPIRVTSTRIRRRKHRRLRR